MSNYANYRTLLNGAHVVASWGFEKAICVTVGAANLRILSMSELSNGKYLIEGNYPDFRRIVEEKDLPRYGITESTQRIPRQP